MPRLTQQERRELQIMYAEYPVRESFEKIGWAFIRAQDFARDFLSVYQLSLFELPVFDTPRGRKVVEIHNYSVVKTVDTDSLDVFLDLLCVAYDGLIDMIGDCQGKTLVVRTQPNIVFTENRFVMWCDAGLLNCLLFEGNATPGITMMVPPPTDRIVRFTYNYNLGEEPKTQCWLERWRK